MAPSSSFTTWVYDVFPSFSGEDVRVTFLSHFLKELDRKLIIPFKDNEMERSRSLDPELKQAIKDSRIAVVVISKNYASSSWCLNELLEIVNCKEEYGQMVIPVFYALDPSHVRKQTGDFGKIFEETCKNSTKEVTNRWRSALTDVANILGYHSVSWGNEAKMIEEIANDVLDKLLLTPSKDSEDFVGIKDHIANMSVLLNLESEEVRMVGIWGSSGIGKTTIARALYNQLSRHFQNSIFIDRSFLSKSMEIYNIANPDDYNMKLHLQRNFLSEILGKKHIKLNHLSAVEERLKHQKVLIFIDDLDDQVVLDALVGEPKWFGNASRIIVVTNDKHFLRAHGIDCHYEVCLPSEDLAQDMLCQYAFRKKSPPEGFEKLVVEVARHAGCLPLGLNVLGSSLRGRDKEYWMDMLPRLQNGIDEKIEKTLRVSYDGLGSEQDKAIFRHIACFFNGAEVTYMKLLLADSDLGVNIALGNLADKSLIDVRLGIVRMHRLLQEMGKKGSKKILGISLDIDEIDELHVHESAFKGMRNLRFLDIYSKSFHRLGKQGILHLPESFDYFPPKLKLLCWPEYPMRCMPSKFRPEKLVKLKMNNSKLEKLWEGVVSLTCLNVMDLWGSHNLKEIPDLSKATNLEILELGRCYSLVEFPSSIPYPNKLKILDMHYCGNLETIPIGINLQSLDHLNLYKCSQLRTFPEISTNISELYIDETAIEEFPANMRLENLCELRMENLKSKKLWEGVQPLTPLMAMLSPSLTRLWLSDISSLVELPSSFQNLHNLRSLKVANCVNLETLPTGMNLQSLCRLDFSGCSRLRTFPDISTTIRGLHLGQTAIEEVPWWIEKFSRLKFLEMKGCNKLEYVNLNISKLKDLSVDFSDCKALTGASWNDSPRSVLNYVPQRVHINFTNCFNLDQEALYQLFHQRSFFYDPMILPGEEVPSYFTHRTTGASSSLTIPLLHSSLSQPFFRFRACTVFNCDNMSELSSGGEFYAKFHFKGRFWNTLDSFRQPQDFWAGTEMYTIWTTKKDTRLFILDCRIPLRKDSAVLAEMNYNHVDIQIHISNISHSPEEWGIRLLEDCSSAENGLGSPNTPPHVFETDLVTETSSKRMRIS
ncbi:hypothetical protein EUTSA_v10003136mg [Eutrema salsugineum]|uniref:ADP-ribosyl cyclase/cyclic ADP-ribose hydrolase n=1 Tax=Eutrema salsugineum TaxID=72664 RepID=V4L370_EUTSA|nr:hypothetical protein EUTSA_v10003136mg [Eutrema salsugineum]